MKSFTPQNQIDELLNSDSSVIPQPVAPKAKKSEQVSEDYDQEFDEYEQTRKSQSYAMRFHSEPKSQSSHVIKYQVAKPRDVTQSMGSIQIVDQSIPKTEFEESRMSKTGNVIRPLQVIKEQQPKKKPPNQKPQNKKTPKPPVDPSQKYLPYNFNKLRDMEKERLFTSLYEDFSKSKQQFNQVKAELKTIQAKYNALLEKSVPADRAKEQALIKENNALRQKVQSLLQLKRKNDEQNSFSKLSRPQKQEPEVNQREQDLLKIVDQFKNRLRETQANLRSLQFKMNQGLDFEKHFKEKARLVQSLEYKMNKLTEQAESDRLLIEQLKLKVQQAGEKLTQQRDKSARAERQFRRIELAVATNNDLVKELDQVKKQKDRLEKSLRQVTGTLVSRVAEKNKEAQKKLQPIGTIEVLDLDSFH